MQMRRTGSWISTLRLTCWIVLCCGCVDNRILPLGRSLKVLQLMTVKCGWVSCVWSGGMLHLDCTPYTYNNWSHVVEYLNSLNITAVIRNKPAEIIYKEIRLDLSCVFRLRPTTEYPAKQEETISNWKNYILYLMRWWGKK